MDWTELITSKIEETYAATDHLMAMVKDDELGWKPASGDNWMTVGQLLKHLTEACGFCCKGFVTGDWGLPEGVSFEDLPPEQMMPPAEKMPTVDTVAGARGELAADKKTALAMVAEAGEANLASREMEAPWEQGAPKPLGKHLLDMVGHLELHKAQLYYYLKLMGRPVNTKDLWGM
jgi:hypothetical protein